jgi:hypothetical protein
MAGRGPQRRLMAGAREVLDLLWYEGLKGLGVYLEASCFPGDDTEQSKVGQPYGLTRDMNGDRTINIRVTRAFCLSKDSFGEVWACVEVWQQLEIAMRSFMRL